MAGLLYLSHPTDSFIFSKQRPCALIPHGCPLGSGTASPQICVLILLERSLGLWSEVLNVKIYVGHSIPHTCERAHAAADFVPVLGFLLSLLL